MLVSQQRQVELAVMIFAHHWLSWLVFVLVSVAHLVLVDVDDRRTHRQLLLGLGDVVSNNSVPVELGRALRIAWDLFRLAATFFHWL